LPADEEAARLERGEAFAWRLSLDAARRALGGFDRLASSRKAPDRTARPA
jgi:glutamyl-Q tRNA(Asp) synthetase